MKYNAQEDAKSSKSDVDEQSVVLSFVTDEFDEQIPARSAALEELEKRLAKPAVKKSVKQKQQPKPTAKTATAVKKQGAVKPPQKRADEADIKAPVPDTKPPQPQQQRETVKQPADSVHQPVAESKQPDKPLDIEPEPIAQLYSEYQGPAKSAKPTVEEIAEENQDGLIFVTAGYDNSWSREKTVTLEELESRLKKPVASKRKQPAKRASQTQCVKPKQEPVKPKAEPVKVQEYEEPEKLEHAAQVQTTELKPEPKRIDAPETKEEPKQTEPVEPCVLEQRPASINPIAPAIEKHDEPLEQPEQQSQAEEPQPQEPEYAAQPETKPEPEQNEVCEPHQHEKHIQPLRIAELFDLPARQHTEHYRHELKYLISYADKAELEVRMASILKLDPNAQDGGYFIRSLYFDDYWNSAYAEKEAGVLMRKKYRIRIYNCSDASIKLERKKKFGSWIYKESAPLTHAEFDSIMAGDYAFLLQSPHNLCREFYTECVCNVLRPRVIVDYDREPWVMDAGTVRVTFDMNVRAAVGGWDIFDPSLPTLPVLEPGKLVMEVKFTEYLPQIVRELLPPRAQELTAVSKYVMCYDKTAYQHGFEYWNET